MHKVRIGHTEWPSITACVQDMVLCVLLNRHDFEQHSCRRCGVVEGVEIPMSARLTLLIGLVLVIGCNYLAIAGYMLWWPWAGHW
jgi:hypothetical protein